MIPYILGVLGLWIAQTFIAPSIIYLSDKRGLKTALNTALGGRDNPPPTPILAGRAGRALGNMQEALPVFMTLALLLQMGGEPNALATNGALLFLVARIVYVPAYLSAITGVRSMVWMASWGGLGMMIAALLG